VCLRLNVARCVIDQGECMRTSSSPEPRQIQKSQSTGRFRLISQHTFIQNKFLQTTHTTVCSSKLTEVMLLSGNIEMAHLWLNCMA
jgi:hypothetical protein